MTWVNIQAQVHQTQCHVAYISKTPGDLQVRTEHASRHAYLALSSQLVLAVSLDSAVRLVSLDMSLHLIQICAIFNEAPGYASWILGGLAVAHWAIAGP